MRWWFDRIVPVIGRLAGQGDAYSYLVRSVQAYPSPERIAEIMGEAGLVDVRWEGLTGGIVTLHEGTVPGPLSLEFTVTDGEWQATRDGLREALERSDNSPALTGTLAEFTAGFQTFVAQAAAELGVRCPGITSAIGMPWLNRQSPDS